MIKEQLKQIGLSEKEAEVYLCVLEHTTITPAQISKKTGISRPTVYAAGTSLQDKGFIAEEPSSAGVRFVALSPSAIVSDLEKRQDDLDAKFAIAGSLVEELNILPKSQEYSVPKVRFIDDAHFMEYAFKKSDEWDKSALSRDATWWGIQDSSLVNAMDAWLMWYWKRADKKIKTKIITNSKEEGYTFKGQNNPRREMRYWRGSDHIRATNLVIGDYILIVNTFKKPYSIFEIYDAVTADGLRQVFKGVWDDLG
jgi:predicted transcriptional regulator